MYSLNHDDFSADGHWPLFMSWVYHAMDETGASVNQECVTAMADKYVRFSFGDPSIKTDAHKLAFESSGLPVAIIIRIFALHVARSYFR
jgi:hypothetical protein